ncbi:hypothetical protein IE985_24710 [Klebsiella pneumoniae]|nr:hypothetical protein [Klebsiella pneumoniae]
MQQAASHWQTLAYLSGMRFAFVEEVVLSAERDIYRSPDTSEMSSERRILQNSQILQINNTFNLQEILSKIVICIGVQISTE